MGFNWWEKGAGITFGNGKEARIWCTKLPVKQWWGSPLLFFFPFDVWGVISGRNGACDKCHNIQHTHIRTHTSMYLCYYNKLWKDEFGESRHFKDNWAGNTGPPSWNIVTSGYSGHSVHSSYSDYSNSSRSPCNTPSSCVLCSHWIGNNESYYFWL